MFWSEGVPRLAVAGVEVVCVAGSLTDGTTAVEPLRPPPDSWAAAVDNDVAIWTLRIDPGARWTLPPARHRDARRCLYYFAGDSLQVGGRPIAGHAAIELRAEAPAELVNDGSVPAEFLMLQGRPIGEPIAQHGPIVMNTELQLQQAFADYQRTRFGGWPWPDPEPVHGPDASRFARHVDGRIERRGR
jgi:redox-sensitive bicupin YhaK (pirin superfamily)